MSPLQLRILGVAAALLAVVLLRYGLAGRFSPEMAASQNEPEQATPPPARAKPPASTPTPTPPEPPAKETPPPLSEREQRIQELRSLLNPGAAPPSARPTVALALRAPRDAPFSAALQLQRELRGAGAVVTTRYFTPAFLESAFFDELFAGATDLLRDSDLLAEVDYALLATLQTTYHAGSTLSRRTVSCELYVTYTLIERSGRQIAASELRVVGAGFSESQALRRTLEMLAEGHAAELLGPALTHTD